MKANLVKGKCMCIQATYKHDRNELAVNGENITTGYALAWLHLTNNVREYSSLAFKIENTASNTIYVWCMHESVEQTKSYLEGIGFIADDVREVDSYQFVGIWETKDYDDDNIDDAVFWLADCF